MNGIVGRLSAIALLFALGSLSGPRFAIAEVQLSSDWQPRFLPDGSRIPDEKHEVSRLMRAVDTAAKQRTAVQSDFRAFEPALSFKMRLDGRAYYLAPVRFMSKSRPDETCHPAADVSTPRYQCEEGQRHTQDCHLFVFDNQFREVGYQKIRINETVPIFCNAVPGVGAAAKERNEIFITSQYFPIDGKPADKMETFGGNWRRSTQMFRLTEADGRILFEQDDSCLDNPNNINSIPDARKRLADCSRRTRDK